MGGEERTGGDERGFGPIRKKKDGTYGTKKDAKKTSSRNEFRTFVKEGGVTGAIIKKIGEANKKSKAKKQANVEVGLGTDSMSNYGEGQGGTREGGDGGDNQKTVLASTPKKVIDTVDAKDEGKVKVKDTNVASTAPTKAEVSQAQATDMSSDQILVANKKKGRSQTILNKAKGLGDTKATIFKRTLGA